jgi:hypothetical protein
METLALSGKKNPFFVSSGEKRILAGPEREFPFSRYCANRKNSSIFPKNINHIDQRDHPEPVILL